MQCWLDRSARHTEDNGHAGHALVRAEIWAAIRCDTDDKLGRLIVGKIGPFANGHYQPADRQMVGKNAALSLDVFGTSPHFPDVGEDAHQALSSRRIAARTSSDKLMPSLWARAAARARRSGFTRTFTKPLWTPAMTTLRYGYLNTTMGPRDLAQSLVCEM